jgi:hypothetical protein
MMRRKALGFVVLSLLASALGYAGFQLALSRSERVRPGASQGPYNGEPVPLNVGPEIAEGFRGDFHPLLHGHSKLELTAYWVPGESERHAGKTFRLEGYRFFLRMKPAVERRSYTEHDFSGFLPEKLGEVGQVWSIDPTKVAKLLRQFHPSVSMHINAEGRRVGPDGAFAVLRAVSPSHLDIAFRAHAEFDLTSELAKNLPAGRGKLLDGGWYTPAHFSGRMIVNRDSGTVEYFQLGLPTDRTLNVHLTLKPVVSEPLSHHMGHVDRMELVGGKSEPAAKDSNGKEAITCADANRRLEHLFYKFMDIDWLPFERVLAAAREKKRPILVVALWGNLDDQSC